MADLTETGARRRRGRPYRAPSDLTAPAAAVPEQRPRLAWLLGSNRMLRQDGAYAHRRDFLAALADHGVPCDESKLSRWESGAANVPDAAIRAYEEILGLEPQSLRSAVGLEIDPSPLRRGTERSPHEVDRLITAMLDGNATGPEWIALTDELMSDREIYLRAGEWSQLTSQLLSEQARALGTAFVSRSVAATRLAAHPAAQPHFVRSVGAIVLDERVSHRESAVRLLGSLQGQRAWSLMLRLCSSGALAVRLGALEVALRHVGDEPRTRQELLTLEKALAQLLEELPGDRSLLALADQLPEPSAQFLALIQARGSLDPVTISPGERAIAAGLARRAQALVQDHGFWDGEPDPMLAALTADALFHPIIRRARAAYGVLDASPYRDTLAAAALEVAGRNPTMADPVAWTAARMAYSLQHHDGEAMLRVAESTKDVRRRVELVMGLGGHPDRLSAEQLGRLSALQDCTEVVDAAVHALGMLGQLPGLRPTGRPELDERAATMSSWWLTHGSRVEI